MQRITGIIPLLANSEEENQTVHKHEQMLDMLRCLRAECRNDDLKFLGYLIDMAAEEASKLYLGQPAIRQKEDH